MNVRSKADVTWDLENLDAFKLSRRLAERLERCDEARLPSIVVELDLPTLERYATPEFIGKFKRSRRSLLENGCWSYHAVLSRSPKALFNDYKLISQILRELRGR